MKQTMNCPGPNDLDVVPAYFPHSPSRLSVSHAILLNHSSYNCKSNINYPRRDNVHEYIIET